MTNIHLYKLITGETMIAELVEISEINGEDNFIVRNPKIVTSQGCWDGEFEEWLIGSVRTEYPIPKKNIIVGVDESEIQDYIMEAYTGYTNV